MDKRYNAMLKEAHSKGEVPARLPLVYGKVVKKKPGKGNPRVFTNQSEIARLKRLIGEKVKELEERQALEKQILGLEAETQLTAFGG